MLSFFYDLGLLLFALLSLPKLLWQRFAKGKYKSSLRARLGLTLPSFHPKPGQKVIWIHAVSVGEARAAATLYHLLRKAYPQAAIVISTTTETGQAEAQRSMPDAAAYFFLPLDFSWTIRRVLAHVRPTLLILCESDFWYHLLKLAKKQGAQIALVNGKVSERSCSRFRALSRFTRQLFAPFDILCLQSERYRARFLSMGLPEEKLHVTGNLKLDTPIKKMSHPELSAFKKSLGIQEGEKVLVIGSTHAPEEEKLLAPLKAIWERLPHLKVLLVPRHPERFDEVAHLLERNNIPFSRLSQKSTPQRLVLVDAMGILNACYQIADLALVGGSYIPHIGGHNIFEPAALGVPVLFGPHMHNQEDLKELLLAARAGIQAPLEKLPETIIELLENPAVLNTYSYACRDLSSTAPGATERTFFLIASLPEIKH